jgi:hypothetical protein
MAPNAAPIATALPTPGFRNGSYGIGYAYAINGRSTIVGYAYAGNQVHTFRWRKSGGGWPNPEDLGHHRHSGKSAFAHAATKNGVRGVGSSIQD